MTWWMGKSDEDIERGVGTCSLFNGSALVQKQSRGIFRLADSVVSARHCGLGRSEAVQSVRARPTRATRVSTRSKATWRRRSTSTTTTTSISLSALRQRRRQGSDDGDEGSVLLSLGWLWCSARLFSFLRTHHAISTANDTASQCSSGRPTDHFQESENSFDRQRKQKSDDHYVQIRRACPEFCVRGIA
jgi:hypothetical protein